MEYYIEKIQKNEFKQVALILTNAFETNPAYALVFNHTNKAREGLRWLFETDLYLINRRHTVTNVIKEKKSNSIIGTFSLIPPGGVKNSFSDYLHIRLPEFILKFGIKSLIKILELNELNKNTLKHSIQAGSYYYLSMVVIKKEFQGKGVGSFAIKNCLNELAQTEKSCRLVGLTTQLLENVRFYSRLGFEKISEGFITCKTKENQYYNWNMKFE